MKQFSDFRLKTLTTSGIFLNTQLKLKPGINEFYFSNIAYKDALIDSINFLLYNQSPTAKSQIVTVSAETMNADFLKRVKASSTSKIDVNEDFKLSQTDFSNGYLHKEYTSVTNIKDGDIMSVFTALDTSEETKAIREVCALIAADKKLISPYEKTEKALQTLSKFYQTDIAQLEKEDIDATAFYRSSMEEDDVWKFFKSFAKKLLAYTSPIISAPKERINTNSAKKLQMIKDTSIPFIKEHQELFDAKSSKGLSDETTKISMKELGNYYMDLCQYLKIRGIIVVENKYNLQYYKEHPWFKEMQWVTFSYTDARPDFFGQLEADGVHTINGSKAEIIPLEELKPRIIIVA